MKLPDPDNMNAQRIEWAESALNHFAQLTCCVKEEAIPDLLCNIMHLCAEQEIDFAYALRIAKSNFKEETAK